MRKGIGQGELMKVRLKKGVIMKDFSVATFGSTTEAYRYRAKELHKPLKASATNQGGLIVTLKTKTGYLVPMIYNSKDKDIWEVIEENDEVKS